MNIILPYANFNDSARVLDDKRLSKQILECKQIIIMVERKKANPNYKSPYLNHPVVNHYFNELSFIATYGLVLCREFKCRFEHEHSYHSFFEEHSGNATYLSGTPIIYASGPKTSAICIRETRPQEVYKLFREKLIRKWEADTERSNPPCWHKRQAPDFYLNYEKAKTLLTSQRVFNELKALMNISQKQTVSGRLQFFMDNNDFIFYDLYDELNRWIRAYMPEVYNKFIENLIRRTIND